MFIKIKSFYKKIKEKIKLEYRRHQACKKIKQHFAKRYYNFINSYLAGNLSEDDIDAFTTYEPTIYSTLKMIADKKEELIKQEAYKARMSRDETLCDVLMEEAQAELKLLTEEEMRVAQNPANSPEDIDQKMSKLELVRKKREQTEFIIADLQNVKEALHPKRKPGRPPKNPKPATAATAKTQNKAISEQKEAQEAKSETKSVGEEKTAVQTNK